VIAGGQENMSASPHVLPGSRDGQRMGDWKMVDTMIVDGLWDVYNQYHMGITAENVAKQYGITREDAGRAGAGSQQKAAAAQAAGKFKDEIVPVSIPQRKGRPGGVRHRRVHQHQDQRRSPGRPAPRLRQGGQRDRGQRLGHQRRRCRRGGDDGQEGRRAGPEAAGAHRQLRHRRPGSRHMGMGPVPASQPCAAARRLEGVGDLDLLEINEAFAAQACAVNKEMGWDTSKVNVNGGAIAIGHPIGASGCRILVTLLHEMQRSDAKKGIASLCIGGGMGVA
jgi:acetyl-CoA C-acetyltransferase